MAFSIKFNEEKNQLLKATRSVSFEDVMVSIKEKKLVDNIAHPNKKYAKQQIYIVEIKGYIYAVPYVIDTKKKEIFLKTIYPSRVLMKKYKKGGIK